MCVARVAHRYTGSYVDVCNITVGTHSYLDEKERDNYVRSVYKQWHVKEEGAGGSGKAALEKEMRRMVSLFGKSKDDTR